MNLPNRENAAIPEAKITEYLLSDSHRDGQHKAAFFRRFGYRLSRGVIPMIRDHDTVALTVDLPDYGLCRDDLGTVVLTHGGKGFEVEFMTLDGQTMAVVSLTTDQVRPIRRREIAHARAVAAP
jgi:hypothetical protein